MHFAAIRCVTSYSEHLKIDRIKGIKEICHHPLVSTYVTVNIMGAEPRLIPTDIRNTFPTISITYPANVQQWKTKCNFRDFRDQYFTSYGKRYSKSLFTGGYYLLLLNQAFDDVLGPKVHRRLQVLDNLN